jgi:CHAT domain
MDAMRFDILSLNSGVTADSVRTRLETYDPDSDPVVVVRRQLIGSVSWHRIGLRQLISAVSGADADVALSLLITLDAGNEVAAKVFGEAGADPFYGVLLLGEEAIAFSQGAFATAEEPRRGSGSPPPISAPPPSPGAIPAPSPHPAPEGGPVPEEVLAEEFSAYPAIEAPTTVHAMEPFEVRAGVANVKPAATITERFSIVDLDPGQEKVRLEVMVSGPFVLAEGSSNVGFIEVDRKTFEHEPLVVGFTATDPPDTYDPQVGVWVARVVAAYFYDGTLVGEGSLEIRVNETAARHVDRQSDREPVETDTPMLVFGADDPDLTISITSLHTGSFGDFNVRLFSRHLRGPVDAGTIHLGQDARQFASRLVREVDYTIANPVADETLNTIGRLVAEKLPAAVEATLRTVWEAASAETEDGTPRRIPDVLLLTDEWAVPWELMSISLDDSSPPFLGAQVNVGRWPNQRRDRLIGDVLGVHRLGVMVGHYQDARGVQPLPRAEEEGRSLAERYDARLVDADPTSLDQMLAGSLEDGYEIEGLHFAGHGESDPSKGTYLMYSDGARMGVFALGSAPVAANKDVFLFVNACQVGTADEMLGEYSGLAGLVVGAGFRGFIAPLWSVADHIAQQISLGLYEASAEGVAVSSYLREVRSQFRQTATESAHTTYMAYVFFGHPALRLGGPERRRQS